MSATVDPKNTVTFDKSIILSYREGNEQTTNGTIGQLRFNQTTLKFEGYHSSSGALLGDIWQPLSHSIATTTNLGSFKVGANLLINESTGVLSSIASGSGRITQLIITVSPIIGAADYISIKTAIANAIGTPAGNYLDGSITSVIGSAPSATYPFIIQLAPGLYIEATNKIVLPDYVSCIGEGNYNCIIRHTGGANTNISDGSMLRAGNNSLIKNIVFDFTNTSPSNTTFTNGIYINSKNNTIIDNCFFTINTLINTTAYTGQTNPTPNTQPLLSSLYINNSNNTIISNSQFIYNFQSTSTSSFFMNVYGIYIINSLTKIYNNIITFDIDNYFITNGIYIENTDTNDNINTINNTLQIDNLKLHINAKLYTEHTHNHYGVCGLSINNSNINLKNSHIECDYNEYTDVANTEYAQSKNYGIKFTGINTSYITHTTSTNIISFQKRLTTDGIDGEGYDTINSSNSATVNFFTLGFITSQFIRVVGSSHNNGIYKIAYVNSATPTTLYLDPIYTVINESASSGNTIIITSLYNIDILDTTFNTSSNALYNKDANALYNINIKNVINKGKLYDTYPSNIIYNDYTLITVGRYNCDYKLLSDALDNITGNNEYIKYKIIIAPGVYTEYDTIVCKPYVDIEGAGNGSYTDINTDANTTTLQFYKVVDIVGGIPNNNASCIVLASHMKINNLKIINSNIIYDSISGDTLANHYTSNSTTCIVYASNNNPYNTNTDNPGILSNVSNTLLENISLVSNCGSAFNYGTYFNNATALTLNNISALTYNNFNNIDNPSINIINTGLTFNTCSGSGDIICNGLTILANSAYSNVNIGINCIDTKLLINNINCNVSNGKTENTAIKTDNISASSSAGAIDNIIEIVNGAISAKDNIDYSLYADSYYTIICNNVKLNGETYTSPTKSYIICNGCYTYSINNNTNNNANNTNNNVNPFYTSINSRGQLEQQLYNTLTIGDTSGKLYSSGVSGINNVFAGVNTGSNVSTTSNTVIIGALAGRNLTTGNDTILIGANTGSQLTTGSHNTLLGARSGTHMTLGSYNIINGSNTGNLLTTGNTNTLIGYNTGNALTTGNLNIFMGTQAGNHLTTGEANTLIGSFAGANINTGNNNTYVGNEAGLTTTSGEGSGGGGGSDIINNVSIGAKSTTVNFSSNIVAVGYASGYNNNTAVKNTYLGFQSGYNTSGNCNTIIGNNACVGGGGGVAGAGSYNTVIGTEAGYSLNNGNCNILVGASSTVNGASQDSAGWSITDGSDNICIGVKAGAKAITAINNVLIGSNVGSNITTSSNNVIIGKDTGTTLDMIGNSIIIGSGAGDGLNNTTGGSVIIGTRAGLNNTGDCSYAIGYNAGSNISGHFNMFMGYNSGGLSKLDTSGEFNIAIGPYTAFNLTTGGRNTIIGSGNSVESAGRQLMTGSDNTLLGFKAGRALVNGNNNTLIGSNAGANLTNGENNTLIGYKSGFSLNTGLYNVIIGPESGYSLNTGSYNICAGYQSGYNIISGDNNINVGYKSGFSGVANSNNIHLGNSSGFMSTADNNIFIGLESGLKNTTGTQNICLGIRTGSGENNAGTNGEHTGDNNIFMGTEAGYSNNNGNRNIYMGYNAGKDTMNGSKNIFLGDNAGQGSQTSHNIFIGSANDDNKGVGWKSISGGEKNVFIGSNVGIENTTGSDNIFLGDNAGNANTTGIKNIYIGTNAGKSANNETADFNIAIGSDAGQNNQSGRENILIGKNVANNDTSTNYNKNIIIGSDAGQNIQQDNQIFIGSNAGKNNTTGDRNIFIGLNAGTTNIISKDNIIIGSDAGVSLTGNITVGGLSYGVGNNIIVGTNAGNDLTTGINNIIMGVNACSNSITTFNSVVIGSQAMANGNANNVIIIGNNAGLNNTVDGSIFIGSNAGLINNSEGCIFIGNNAGLNNNDGGNPGGINGAIHWGFDNVFIGESSGTNNTIGDSNTFLGAYAGEENIIGSNNVYVGRLAGNINNGDSNTAIGASALHFATTSNLNVCIGQEAGFNTNADANIFIGSGSGYSNTNGYGNICLGIESGKSNILGIGNINIGPFACSETILGELNTVIGPYAGLNSNCSRMVAIGYNAGTYNTANGCIFIGSNAGINNTTGIANLFMGIDSGRATTTGSTNLIMGSYAGTNNITGNTNIFIGSNAGYSNATGNDNLIIGSNAGYTNTTGNTNIFMGSNAGRYNRDFDETLPTRIMLFNDVNSNGTVLMDNMDNNIGTDELVYMFPRSNTLTIPTTGSGDGSGLYNCLNDINADYNSYKTLTYNSFNFANNGSTAITNTVSTITISNKHVFTSNINSSNNSVLSFTGNTIISTSADQSLLINFQDITAGMIITIAGSLSNNGTFTVVSNVFTPTYYDGTIMIFSKYTLTISTSFTTETYTTPTRTIIITTPTISTFTTSNLFFLTFNTVSGSNIISVYGVKLINYSKIRNSDLLTISGSVSNNNTYTISTFNTTTNKIYVNTTLTQEPTQIISITNNRIGGSPYITDLSLNRYISIYNNTISTYGDESNTISFTNYLLNDTLSISINSIVNGTTYKLSTNCIYYRYSINVIGSISGIGVNTSNNDTQKSLSFNIIKGNNNSYIGYNTGGNVYTRGESNILLGSNSGGNISSAKNNIMIGVNAGRYIDNGTGFIANNNIFLGSNAALYSTYSANQIVIGNNAGLYVSGSGTGAESIIIGNECGSSYRILFGQNILMGTKIGYGRKQFIIDNGVYSTAYTQSNIIIGHYAGYNYGGIGSILIGFETGYNLCKDIADKEGVYPSSYTIFLGHQSGYSTTSGQLNTFLGYQTGYFNTTGSKNFLIGYKSGFNNITGNSNAYLGYNAGYDNQNGNNNICIGERSGYRNYGSTNINIGKYVGQINNGSNNIFIGSETVIHPYITSYYSDKFAIYKTSTYGITSNTDANCTILIGGDFTSGRVGIGTLNPGDFSTTSQLTGFTDIKLVVLGKVLANNFLSFTGSHIVNLSANIDINKLLIGMIMCSTGIAVVQDVNNTTVTVDISNTHNDKKSFGVFSGSEIITTTDYIQPIETLPEDITNDEIIIDSQVAQDINTNTAGFSKSRAQTVAENNTNLDQSTQNNNTDDPPLPPYPPPPPLPPPPPPPPPPSPPPPSPIPVITTKTNYYVNSLGEGGILVSNYSGEIQNGDYITTSIIGGYGALQSDDLKHSYTVAKCTQDIVWNTIENNILCELDNKMYKSLLVSCVYTC